MTKESPIIFLSGAGGGMPDFSIFRETLDDASRYQVVSYPEWKRFVWEDLSAEGLIAEIVKQIATMVPQGPIRIIGLSIGGHFGYAAALRLAEMGREITGFCAIDSFMVLSSRPSAGWKGRAVVEGINLLRKGRLAELARFLRSKFWRALVRLAGRRLPALVRKLSSSGKASPAALDQVFEGELSMRLLIETAAPWIASLDREPRALKAPAILLRTNLTAADDASWRLRCPNLEIFEIPGQHHSIFEAENVSRFQEIFLTATQNWRATPNCQSSAALDVRV